MNNEKRMILAVVSHVLEFGECQNITQNIALSQYPSRLMTKSREVPDVLKQAGCISNICEYIY